MLSLLRRYLYFDVSPFRSELWACVCRGEGIRCSFLQACGNGAEWIGSLSALRLRGGAYSNMQWSLDQYKHRLTTTSTTFRTGTTLASHKLVPAQPLWSDQRNHGSFPTPEGSSVSATSATTGKKLFRCHLCPSELSSKGHLIDHIRRHTGERPHRCDQCPKTFTHRFTLVTHMRSHTGEKPYQCEQCPKAFVQLTHLVNHKRTHTGEKPFRCDLCQKVFSRRSHLVTHTRQHTGEKPFQCDVCQRLFTDRSNMLAHKRQHH